MKTILLTAANAIEVHSIIRRLNLRKNDPIAKGKLYFGNFKKLQLYLLLTGMGMKNSELSLRSAFDHLSPDLVLNLGTAGSVDDNLDTLTIFFPEEFTAEDMKILQPSKQFTDKLMAECKNTLDHNIATGRLFTSPYSVGISAKRRLIRTKYHCSAVDMEAYPQSAVSTTLNIPFVSIKVISDKARFPVIIEFIKNFIKVNSLLKTICIECLTIIHKHL